MSAKFRLEEIREFRTARNGRQPIANKAKLADIQAKIASEIKDVKRGIDKVKYPLRSSNEIAHVAIGTAQQTNALLFLQGSPRAERIASEIRNGFERGEVDYGWTLLENCLNDIRKDVAGEPHLTEAQKWLKGEVESIYNSFEGKGRIEELEGELKTYSKAELIARDFAEQEQRGVEALVSPELFPLLSEAERSESMQQATARKDVSEIINFKRRAAEAMSSH